MGSVGPSEASFVWVGAAVLLHWTLGNTHISLYDRVALKDKDTLDITSLLNVVRYSWTNTKSIIKRE